MLPALLLSLLPQDADALDAHLRNVHLERRLAFESAWALAGEERRQLVRDLFQARRETGVPAVYQLSAQLLTEAAAVLTGEVDEAHALPWERRFACSLDLLVLPGGFEAGEGGRGDEVIVRVLPVTTRTFTPLPETFDLRLVWLGPQGQEIPARQEPIHRTALRMPGFEMYLRAPSSRPGRWHLVPEVVVEERTGRGQPVPVDCALDLFGHFDRLEANLPEEPNAAAAHAAIRRHLLHGVRDAMAPSLPALLDGAPLAPLAGIAQGWGGGETVLLRTGLETPREVVLVVAPQLEEADWVFAGGALEPWLAFATERETQVVSTALPVADPSGPDVLGVLDGLRATFPDVPLTLIVRGPAVGRLSIALRSRDEALPFDRVVVNTVPSPTIRPRRLFEVPSLLLSPLFEAHPLERIPADGPPLFWLRVPDPPLVVDLALPGHLAAWLDALAAASDEDR